MTSPFDDAEARRVQAAGRAAHYAQEHYQRWENGQLQQGQNKLQPAVYDSSDALLGEMLREVLSMAKAMEALRGEVADLRAEIRDKARARVVQFPGNALRHGNPR